MEDNDKEHIQVILNHVSTKEVLSLQQLLLLSMADWTIIQVQKG